MTCEIENTVTRPNGPYGDVVTNGRCLTHSFRTYGVAMNGKLCPIGQIEAATAKAMAQIATMAGQCDPATENVGYDNAPTDPHHGGKLVTEAALVQYTSDSAPVPRAAVKRPRKPKPTEE